MLRLRDVGGERSIRNADRLAAAAHAAMRGLPHEQVWAFFLNGRNDLIGATRLGEGGLHGCALTPLDVLRPVVLSGASGYALAHNHPSGEPTPSVSDWEMTRKLGEASDLLGVFFLDHVIVTQSPSIWVSMRDNERWNWGQS